MQKFKFTIRGNDYEVEIKKMEDSHANIEVNGTTYNVELQKEQTISKTPILRRPAVNYPKGSHKIKKINESVFKVKAPLPGNILQIFVKKGDEIKKGDKLLQYEAMKMENNLLSEKNGIVAEIKVKLGDNVLQDVDLIYLELK